MTRDRFLEQKRFVRTGRSSWKVEQIYQRAATSFEEVAMLLHAAEHGIEGARDLERNESVRRRFAYQAAAQLATIVLRASGYRTRKHLDDQGLFDALADLFAGDGRELRRDVKKLRAQRGTTPPAADWAARISAFRESVLEWLRLKHASLLPSSSDAGPANNHPR
jgi:hypothetical protein